MKEFWTYDMKQAAKAYGLGLVCVALIPILGIWDIPLRLFIQPFIYPLFLILVVFLLIRFLDWL